MKNRSQQKKNSKKKILRSTIDCSVLIDAIIEPVNSNQRRNEIN